jgi:hypothetical protein
MGAVTALKFAEMHADAKGVSMQLSQLRENPSDGHFADWFWTVHSVISTNLLLKLLRRKSSCRRYCCEQGLYSLRNQSSSEQVLK